MKKIIFLTVLGAMLTSESLYAFEIDFSRREKYLHPNQQTTESTYVAPPEKTIAPINEKPETPKPSEIVTDMSPAQEIVIMNTENGFVPKSLSLRAKTKYKIYVVNVNEKEKNVSFIMSAFSQYQGTYFGQMKSFEIVPPKEGTYTYECPETSQIGNVVVIPSGDTRSMASEK